MDVSFRHVYTRSSIVDLQLAEAAADGFLLINGVCGAAERKQIMSTTCPCRTEVYDVPIDTLQHGYK
jgi:hypothetical protein